MRQFFDTLFAYKASTDYILIWRKQGKLSAWFQDIEGAIEYVEANKETDLYVGCGVATAEWLHAIPERNRGHRRCEAASIAGIPGLWLDIDLADPQAHKKSQLPETDKDIEKILSVIPFQPTIRIDSGHGRQLWWIFNEFWVFESDEDRLKAASLAERFTITVKQRAQELGFTIDSTFDLSRVFRIPGTMNTKFPPFVKVLKQTCNGSRFSAIDFDDFIVDEIKRVSVTRPSQTIEGTRFVLNSEAVPPFDKMDALLATEPKFKLSWEAKRKDFKDDSPSAYDFSLANYGLMAGWTWQEIADLIVSFRRKHGYDLKLRYDYYERTIAKAEATVTKVVAQENIDTIILKIDAVKAMDPVDRRKAILENVSSLLGVPIIRIIKYITDPPEYKLITQRGNIILGGVQNLIEQRGLRIKISAAAGQYIGVFQKEKWERIAQALLDVCEDEDVGDEATDEGKTRAWLTAYLSEKRIHSTPTEAYQSHQPFLRNGKLYIFLSSLREWLSMCRREFETSQKIGIALRTFGFRAETITFKNIKDVNITRHTFAVHRMHEDLIQFTDGIDET